MPKSHARILAERMRLYALAEEHWVFIEKWCHQMFIDGFIHGYKHALQEKKVKL